MQLEPSEKKKKPLIFFKALGQVSERWWVLIWFEKCKWYSSFYEPCCLTQSLQQKLQAVIGFSKTCNIFFKNACYLRCSVKKYDQWETCHPDTEQFKLRPFIAESFNSKSSRNLLLSKPLLRNVLQLITCEF